MQDADWPAVEQVAAREPYFTKSECVEQVTNNKRVAARAKVKEAMQFEGLLPKEAERAA